MPRTPRHLGIALAAVLLAACGDVRDPLPRVVVETSAGTMVIELYPARAPATVANFLRHVDSGAYGGSFYRTTRPDNDPLINVIQGGLWNPSSEGDDAFTAPFAPIPHETTRSSGLSHTDGVLSMARGEPGTASSEFFISIGNNPSLDYGGARNPDGQGFAAFGRVVEGMDVARAIHAAPTHDAEGFDGQLLIDPVRILRMGSD